MKNDPCFVCGGDLTPEEAALSGRSSLAAATIRFHRGCATHLAVEVLAEFHRPKRTARPSLQPPLMARTGLSETERRVLLGVARGRTNAGIAAELRLTVKTVKNAVSSLLLKLDLSSRTEAAIWAWRHGLLDEL